MVLSTDYLRAKLSFWIRKKEVNNFFCQKRLFFILSIGRSGTKFLADLLNQSEEALVRHEPVKRDFQAYREAYEEPRKAIDYLNDFRKKEIYLRVKDRGDYFRVYGEVNSLLRRHVLALKKVFPRAVFIHLIRDGRKVVRSIYSRNTFKKGDKNSFWIKPKKGDPFEKSWEEKDRFQKICWYWNQANQYLGENIEQTVRLKDLVTDYGYFENKLLKPLGISLSRKIWTERSGEVLNKSDFYRLPSWPEWSDKRRKEFVAICGKTMEKYGYEI